MGLIFDFSVQKILLIIIITSAFSVKAQTIIGTVFDIEDKTPISIVSVVVYEYNSNKIIGYTTTNDKGVFNLNIVLNKKAYTLKFRHLSFHLKEQNIIVSQESNRKISLSVALHSKLRVLDEIIIKANLPIIVKKDTIIYNIKHWAKANDQTLEEVMSKIDGFKILANGEIEVQGKRVNKVIVNGKEVFDVGASVLTKSLDPSKVKSIEVRFNEKKSKLKENLLNTEKYVVLDIKLKDDFKKSFFGKTRQTTGYKNKLKLGGYTNLFSLNKKNKYHLFAEIDDFGKQTISLKNIKYIGQEAFQKLFELPADFKSLTEKENYQEELYGFNNYYKNKKRVIGFTSKFEITDKLNLFFGSYNSIDNIRKSKFYSQTRNNNTTNNFIEKNNLNEFSSKNKLELKYDTKKTKVVFNTNIVFNNSDYNQENFTKNQFYRFNLNNNRLKSYNNFKFENKINDKIAFEIKSSFANTEETPKNILHHNNPLYSIELIDINNNTIYDLEQDIKIKKQNFISSFMFQFMSKIGIVEMGSIYNNRNLNYKANAKNIPSNNFLQEFTTSNKIYKVQNTKPFLKHILGLGNIYISNLLEYSFLKHKDINNNIKNKQNLNYGLTINYSNNNFNSSIKYNDRLSSFPLNKLVGGSSLLNFQTIETQAISITPQKEKVFEFSIYKDFKKSKTNIVFAILKGKSNSLNLYSTKTSSPFIYVQKNQLEGEYIVISTSLTKTFKNGLSLTLEPELLTNKNQNINSNTTYNSITDRYFLGLKTENNKKNKRLNYFLYSKYSLFNFLNTSTNFISNQEMFSIALNINYELIKNNLFFDLNTRNVSFLGNDEGHFTNINLHLNGKIKMFNWKFTAENILNNQKFIRKSITPLFFTSESNVVFGRYFKLSIEYLFY